MSNETDLDWLARNVHHWPTEAGILFCGTSSRHGAMGWSPADVGFTDKPLLVTKQQWLARRAELQNKPSWDAVPNHANWMAQDAAGTWLWHSTEPEPRNGMWIGEVTRGYAAKGAVLGDWRDTLERRPEEKTRAQAEVDLVNAVAEVFKPIISIEDNQEQDMQQDNGWFERGELPPVGLECEIHHQHWNDNKFEKVQVAAITREYVIVDDGKFEQHYLRKDMSFRPIRTEREKAIEEMVGEFIDHYGDPKGAERYIGIATKLYEIGYRKESK